MPDPVPPPRTGAGPARFVGVTVMPEYIQTEGIEGVLTRLRAAGATAVATCPYVMAPADAETGAREPPIDAGAGGVRLLDRPLWDGRRELYVRTEPSFTPDHALYAGLRYQPAPPGALTRAEGPIIAAFITAAKHAGLQVFLQIQSACPPGYRVSFGGPWPDDLPCLPDGSLPSGRVDSNASLAAPEIRAYLRALITDLCRTYPDIDGIRLDWPEYPPYRLDDMFFDFSPHAEAAAHRLGLDFEAMRKAAADLQAFLTSGTLTNAGLHHLAAAADPLALLPSPLHDLLRLRAALSCELIAEARASLAAAGARPRFLVPNAFPPPWSRLSGMDFAAAARHCDGISVKLYTMHWPMMLRFAADRLLEANPQLDRDLLAATLSTLADTGQHPPPRYQDLTYPDEHTPHPAGADAQARKIAGARSEAGDLPIYALVHGYGPLTDVAARTEIAWNASSGRIWLNRYGYLSNEKLDAIGRITVTPPT